MLHNIVIEASDNAVTAAEFEELFHLQQPHVTLDHESVARMLRSTINITARRAGRLVGIVRIVTDGYLFSAIAEIRSLPDLYYSEEFVEVMLNAAAEAAPTRLVLATHRVNPEILRKCGWEEGIGSYVYLRKRRTGGGPTEGDG